MEQRIDALEEEFKLLKNQIKAVLLDIKDYLATGNGHDYAPHHEDTGSKVAQQEREVTEPAQDVPSDETRPASPKVDTASAVAERTEPAPSVMTGQSAKRDIVPPGDESKGNVIDLLTVSVVAQWLSRAIPAVGKKQISKLVEIYDITGNLPPRLKDAILLLTDLCGGDTQDEEASEADVVPAATSIQLLIELDSLLRSRTNAIESVIFSMLLEHSQGGRTSNG